MILILLLDEGRCIQHYLCTKKYDRMQSDETVARKFDFLMKHGRTRDALRLLSSSSNGNVLQLHDSVFEMTSTGEQISRSVRDILSDKHPKGIPSVYSSLLQDNPAPVNPILFDQLTAQSIYQAALHTEGSAGLSGLDAYAWRRLAHHTPLLHKTSVRHLPLLANVYAQLIFPQSFSVLLWHVDWYLWIKTQVCGQ